MESIQEIQANDFMPDLSQCSLLFQGAEARVYSGLMPTTGQNAIAKYRFPKRYKHPVLDKQTRERRTRAEARSLEAAGVAGLSVPKVLYIDERRTCIYMSLIKDASVATLLKSDPNLLTSESLARSIGISIAKLHTASIIHNDLTTSNLLYNPETDTVSIIDFGLASRSPVTLETMAVDLYVLQRSIMALHGPSSFLDYILKHYVLHMNECSEDGKRGEQVRKQLDEVEKRGRKK